MDKLKQIEASIAVVGHGDIAVAVLMQDVMSVTVGRCINAPEARLDVKLLYRPMCRTAATGQGAVFMEQYKKALKELDRAESLVVEDRYKAVGHLIVPMLATSGRKHVVSYVSDFLRANLDMYISFNLTDRAVDLVHEGYDVGIRTGDAIDLNLMAIRLVPNKCAVHGMSAYFAKHGVPRTLDDPARHSCFVFSL